MAWAASPTWLFPRAAHNVLRCSAAAELHAWGVLSKALLPDDSGGAPAPALAPAPAEEAGAAQAPPARLSEGVAARLHRAHFGNPHMLEYVARLRDSPAPCGLPAHRPGSDAAAAAWWDAQRGAWAGADARAAARAFLAAPFSPDAPLHAAAAAQAARARAAGAAAFARGEAALAAECFTYALAVLPWPGAPASDAAALLSSRAQCALRLRAPAAAEADASASLALRPGHAVTLLRRARARADLGYAAADGDLCAARLALAAQEQAGPPA